MKGVVLFLLLICSIQTSAQHAFTVLPIGVKGGGDESNLSAYAVAAAGTKDFICLDAGTLRAGLQKTLKNDEATHRFLRSNLKAYLLSHAHLDHVAGLVLNSPDDTTKNIYCMGAVRDVLVDKYFTDGAWSNFTDAGSAPRIGRYRLKTLTDTGEVIIENTTLHVRAFELSHAEPAKSTAFLVRSGSDYILYLGDTGPDAVEKAGRLQNLWSAIAPIVRAGKLRGIFIECSFPNDRPERLLFGHLTPKHLFKELEVLAKLSGVENVRGLNVIITHIKPGRSAESTIKNELTAANTLGARLRFAKQGKTIRL